MEKNDLLSTQKLSVFQLDFKIHEENKENNEDKLNLKLASPQQEKNEAQIYSNDKIEVIIL